MTTRFEQHLDVVESACAALDGVEEYGIWEGDAYGLLVLHGLDGQHRTCNVRSGRIWDIPVRDWDIRG